MPHFDYTISLGSVLSVSGVVLTALIIIITFKTKIDLLITLHTEQLVMMRSELKEHREEDNRRFDAMSDRLFDLVSSVQRLVGQTDSDRQRGRE